MPLAGRRSGVRGLYRGTSLISHASPKESTTGIFLGPYNSPGGGGVDGRAYTMAMLVLISDQYTFLSAQVLLHPMPWGGCCAERAIGIAWPHHQHQYRTCPAHCINCTPCQTLLRAVFGWIRSSHLHTSADKGATHTANYEGFIPPEFGG